jgi:pimeloyl-ACP methyl ester carboxylesterase
MKLEIISREPEEKRFLTPLLFIHGSCHGAWAYAKNFLPYFAAKGFSSYAVSLRGHGKSEVPEKFNRVSVADYVADVLRAVENLPEKPVLIGHSLGGFVVQKYLEKHRMPAAVLLAPSPVSGMLLPGMRLQMKSPLLFLKVALKRDFSLLYNTPERLKKHLFSADADDNEMAEYAALIGKESYRAATEMIYNLPKAELIKRTPILVLGGETDEIIQPKYIKKTARAFAADFKIFPATAHDLMLERRWQTAADFMIEWLEGKIQ